MELHDKAGWDGVLYKIGRARFDKIDDDEYIINDECISDDNEEIYDESITDKIVNEPITDIEFANKRDLYNYYGIDINTIPDRYEVNMKYNSVNGKRGQLYKLVKK